MAEPRHDAPPDDGLAALSRDWLVAATRRRQDFGFPTWLGRPVLQLPQDLVAMQEIIWRVKPHLIVETGVAMGGSLVFYASMLALLGGERRVLGIDVEIRPHNREALEQHPYIDRIELVEGSSLDPSVVARAQAAARAVETVLVVLDSNHTHAHVLAELEAYAPLVSPGSYCVVFDTAIAQMPADTYPDRPWGPGDNPLTAVTAFLEREPGFEVDHQFEGRYGITVAPSGYLRRLGGEG